MHARYEAEAFAWLAVGTAFPRLVTINAKPVRFRPDPHERRTNRITGSNVRLGTEMPVEQEAMRLPIQANPIDLSFVHIPEPVYGLEAIYQRRERGDNVQQEVNPITEAVHARMVKILRADPMQRIPQTRLELTELESRLAKAKAERDLIALERDTLADEVGKLAAELGAARDQLGKMTMGDGPIQFAKDMHATAALQYGGDQ